jgi:hypothetical protein
MSRVLIAISVCALFPDCDRAEAGATFVGWTDGKRYTVIVTDDRLKKTASWDTKESNPPLSARDAMKHAVALEKTLLKESGNKTWELESLALTPNEQGSGVEKWYWVAHFSVRKELTASSGPPPDIYIVVLMDGTVIKPIIAEAPRC